MTHATRTSETRALQRKHIDLENETVFIEQSFVANELRPTKTKNRELLPLDPDFKEIYLSMGPGFPEDFVFLKQSGRGKGKPFSESYFRKVWNKAREKAGIGHITLYQGTRHSFASQAVNRGVPLNIIQRFLRHESPKMTERYAHLETKTLKVAQRGRIIDLQENARKATGRGLHSTDSRKPHK
jgi:integrase